MKGYRQYINVDVVPVDRYTLSSLLVSSVLFVNTTE
jgi:hypothetical protein